MQGQWRSIWVIAWSTWREAVRSRLIWVGALGSLALVMMSILAASVAIYERGRLVVDVGLASASGLSSILALASTIALVARDLGGRQAYPLLVRPLSRGSYLTGRFLGLWATMAAVVACQGLTTAAVTYLFVGQVPAALAPALLLTVGEMAIVVAVSLLTATLISPALAAAAAATLLIAGNLSAELAEMAARQTGPTAQLLSGLHQILPDLGQLSLRAQAANDLPVPAGFVAVGMLYAAAYSLTALTGAILLFRRRAAL